MQLVISHLPRCLRTRRFSEPTFRPSGATKPPKNTMFRDFPTFSRICIFFLLALLSSNLSLLSGSSLLCFSSVHIVGSLTSKLPSNRKKKNTTIFYITCFSGMSPNSHLTFVVVLRYVLRSPPAPRQRVLHVTEFTNMKRSIHSSSPQMGTKVATEVRMTSTTSSSVMPKDSRSWFMMFMAWSWGKMWTIYIYDNKYDYIYIYLQ